MDSGSPPIRVLVADVSNLGPVSVAIARVELRRRGDTHPIPPPPILKEAPPTSFELAPGGMVSLEWTAAHVATGLAPGTALTAQPLVAVAVDELGKEYRSRPHKFDPSESFSPTARVLTGGTNLEPA
jgi:hypothetical protein